MNVPLMVTISAMWNAWKVGAEDGKRIGDGRMKEAFEKIIERLKEVGNLEIIAHSGRCNGKTLTLGYVKGIENTIAIVNQVAEEFGSDINVGSKWIPCSDRLPENIKTVIIDVKEIRYPTVGWYGDLTGWHLTERDFMNLKDFTVLAWQPLPEPYKPKGEQ